MFWIPVYTGMTPSLNLTALGFAWLGIYNKELYQTPKEITHSFLNEPYFWRLGIPYLLQKGKLLLAKGI